MLTETQKTEALKYKDIIDIVDKIRTGEVVNLVPNSSLTPDVADEVQKFFVDRADALKTKLEAMSAADLMDIVEEEAREYGLSQAMDSYYISDSEIDRYKARTEILRRLGETG